MLPVLSRSLVNSVRRDMTTRGFALIDTSYFLQGKKWPAQTSKDFKKLNSNPGGHYMKLQECQTDWVKELVKWQERLLKKALPIERLYHRGEGLALRNERFKRCDVNRWHLDGGWIRSICVIKGPTTQVMTDLGESTIPLGWTLFLTARARNSIFSKIRATNHRRPSGKKLRRLIVHGWHSELTRGY